MSPSTIKFLKLLKSHKKPEIDLFKFFKEKVARTCGGNADIYEPGIEKNLELITEFSPI
jgi:hypothetical protein